MGALPKPARLAVHGGAPAALYEILRARIASHELPPGAKLREQALADEFGVSRARVRDALAVLAERGLVERIPARGAVVQRFDFEATLQVLDMRELLEGLAVRLATRNAAPASWDDLIARFEALGSLAGSRRELGRYVASYELFRSRVMAAAASPPLTAALGTLHDKTKMVMRRVLGASDRAARALLEHREVLAAMRAGDALRAERLRRKSIAGAREYLVRFRDFVF